MHLTSDSTVCPQKWEHRRRGRAQPRPGAELEEECPRSNEESDLEYVGVQGVQQTLDLTSDSTVCPQCGKAVEDGLWNQSSL